MDAYIEELTGIIKDTIIVDSAENKTYDYEEGIRRLVALFTKKKEKCSHIFFIGNGGSAAIASHMTADFMKNGGMITYSLYDNAVMTCMGNDYGYEQVFAKPLDFLLRHGDLLVAISSSGKSQNILNAINVAHEKGAGVVTFTGFEKDNPAMTSGDMNVYVPCSKYGIVESIHNLMLQEIVDIIMERDGVRI